MTTPIPQERVAEISRDCPRCDGDSVSGRRVFGEPGWRICDWCGWDELPPRAHLTGDQA